MFQQVGALLPPNGNNGRSLVAGLHDFEFLWGFPENSGYPILGPENKDPTILGYHIRVPYFRNSLMACSVAFMIQGFC